MIWLVSERQVAPATLKQALSAWLFLHTKMPGINRPWMQQIGRHRIKRRLPVVPSREEVAAMFRHLDGEPLLFAQCFYNTGLRLTAGLQLRVKDVDFAHNAIVVREGKGRKDRVVMLPQVLVSGLKSHLTRAHEIWLGDQADGRNGVEMPHALDRKSPRARSSWAWF